jgi:ABC-type oligopeptide transport system ATPase subunit
MIDIDIQFAIKGQKVKAIYQKSEIPEYQDNPLIEALPPILDSDEATEELSHYPEYHEGMCSTPKHIRYHLIQNSLRFFSPLDIHLDLERSFSCLLRVGYTDRNPEKENVWNKIEERVSKLEKKSRSQYAKVDDYKSTAAIGFSIIGISGIGKSQTVERILKLYPQIIFHNRYKCKNFTHTQLVWLKLDCPFDGSIKGLCYNFFLSVDNLLGTTYFDKYAKTARNADEMLPHMARVVANHFIGVLVIDEIQRLSKAKSGGAEKMLDFFVQLVNNIGVPMVLVGTYKALSILSGALSQMRRGAGQGDLVWDRLKFDEQWQLLIEDLWEFQYLHKICRLKDNLDLSRVLYEESQGITDLAIKLFMFSQELAISSGEEKLTTSIIRSAAKAKFNLLQPALRALKNKDKKALATFEDIYPTYLRQSLVDNLPILTNLNGEITNEPEIKIVLNNQSKKEISNPEANHHDNKTDSENQMAVEEFFSQKGLKESRKNISSATRDSSKGILLNIYSSIEKPSPKSVYEALKAKGFISSGEEFISFGSLNMEVAK